MASAEHAASIEHSAFEAWPAAEVFDLGGWRLRATGGVTRRGNSVWPGEGASALSLEDRIDAVERWYAKRSLPAAFQLHPATVPPTLDGALRARGYTVDAPVSVQTAPAAAVAATTSAVPARVERALVPEWFAVSAMRGRFAKTAEVYRGLLERIGPRARFALAEVGGEVCAVGLGVLGAPDERRLGVFSMLTVPEGRRRGAGRAILGALARSAVDDGATELYLQVERENAAALALYASASFAELYGYHYRVRPAAL